MRVTSPGASMSKYKHVFHERFRMCRARAQMSQDEVAERLQVSQNAIGTWERGESQPQVEHIERACRLFGVSANWLCGISESETGLPIGLFLVDLDAAEKPTELETWAVQIPQRPALMTYEQVQKIYADGVRNVRRHKKER